MFALLTGSAHIASGGTALAAERFVLGLVDGTLLSRDDLGFKWQSLFRRQAQLQDLMSLALAALGVIEVTTGAFDLAPGPSLAGIFNHEGALRAHPRVITVMDPPSQFAGEPAPIDVLAAQEIVEHTDLAGQNLAQFGAEAVEGFDFH